MHHRSFSQATVVTRCVSEGYGDRVLFFRSLAYASGFQPF